MLRRGSGQDLEFLLNLFELSKVLQLRNILITIIRVLRVNNHDGSNNCLLKLMTSHARIRFILIKVFFEKDTRFNSDSLGSINVVTRAHADCHACIAALGDGLLDAIAQGIFETIDANQGKIFLQSLLILDGLEVIVLFLEIIELFQGHIFVSD